MITTLRKSALRQENIVEQIFKGATKQNPEGADISQTRRCLTVFKVADP